MLYIGSDLPLAQLVVASHHYLLKNKAKTNLQVSDSRLGKDIKTVDSAIQGVDKDLHDYLKTKINEWETNCKKKRDTKNYKTKKQSSESPFQGGFGEDHIL